jgi:hypothetical protein
MRGEDEMKSFYAKYGLSLGLAGIALVIFYRAIVEIQQTPTPGGKIVAGIFLVLLGTAFLVWGVIVYRRKH